MQLLILRPNSLLLQQTVHILSHKLKLLLLFVLVNQGIEHQSQYPHQQYQQDYSCQDAAVYKSTEFSLIDVD